MTTLSEFTVPLKAFRMENVNIFSFINLFFAVLLKKNIHYDVTPAPAPAKEIERLFAAPAPQHWFLDNTVMYVGPCCGVYIKSYLSV
jgi:hypothetical protein